jgi:type IV pilus assembly protein PilF
MRVAVIALWCLVLAACATTSTNPEQKKVAEGYYDRGLSFVQSNDTAKAMAEFHRSIQTDPNNKQSHYMLGLIYYRQDKLQEAERYLKEAVSIDGQYSDAYNMLGIVYSTQKKWKEALRAYDRALENKLYATPQITYLNIGDMYMAQLDYAKAAGAYRESKNIANTDVTTLRLGDALVKAGRLREAIAEFQEGVKLAPQSPEMHLALGQAYLKDGDKRSARSEFQKVVDVAPKSDAARAAKDHLATIDRSPQQKNTKQ